jgi:protein phosphatase
MRPGIELAGVSDVGCQRENNEDRFAYWEPMADEEFRRKGRLAIIADGMGGHEGGQEASRIAVETIAQSYAAGTEGDPRALLSQAFQQAHNRIHEQALLRPGLQGMGTTCTAMAVVGHELYYSHVGDSRLYLLRGGKIYRLTRDQSYVGKLVEEGIINSEEANSHPQRHILIGALGAGGEVTPESPEQPIALESGDTLLLCTDGLWSLVPEGEILQTLSKGALHEACDVLVRTAKQRGGPDNITLQAVRLM